MIKKAIFPVGGLGTRFLPATKAIPKEMLPVVDKPLIQYAVEEAIEAGCEEFIFVTGRGKSSIENHFDHSFELEHTLSTHHKDEALAIAQSMLSSPGSMTYVRQQEPAGLGHAVWCARHLVHDEPVAILLADDLINSAPGCLKQMVDRYTSGNMVALMEVEPREIQSYGVIDPGAQRGPLVEVKGLIEKPHPNEAPSHLAVIGRYIIEPGVFGALSRQNRTTGGEIQLTDSLDDRIGQVPFFGYLFEGTRYDCGSKIGFLKANIDYALRREEIRDELTLWLKERVKDTF